MQLIGCEIFNIKIQNFEVITMYRNLYENSKKQLNYINSFSVMAINFTKL